MDGACLIIYKNAMDHESWYSSPSCAHMKLVIVASDVVLEDVLGLEDDVEDRFVKSLASTVWYLALASALLGLGFCTVLGSRTRYF